MKKGKSSKEMGDIRKKALEHYLELLGNISDSDVASKYGAGRNIIAGWKKADKGNDIVAETKQSTGKKSPIKFQPPFRLLRKVRPPVRTSS